MCEFVQFSLFPPSTKWWPLRCDASLPLKLIAQTIRTHTHTHTYMIDECPLVCECESRVRIFLQWLINKSVSDDETFDRFFRSFLRVCVCDNFCDERAVVFAFRFCVCVSFYLPWRVICIAINGFHTQQFGFSRNQENK